MRYSYVPNEDLVSASHSNIFEEAKDFIVEGLSVRLNPAGAVEKKSTFKINLMQRNSFKVDGHDCLPDGTPIIPVDEPEVLVKEGNDADDDGDYPIDPDTDLPVTGIDINTGLPIDLPEGVEFKNPVTGAD